MIEGKLKKKLLIIDDDRIFCETVKDYLAITRPRPVPWALVV